MLRNNIGNSWTSQCASFMSGNWKCVKPIFLVCGKDGCCSFWNSSCQGKMMAPKSIISTRGLRCQMGTQCLLWEQTSARVFEGAYGYAWKSQRAFAALWPSSAKPAGKTFWKQVFLQDQEEKPSTSTASATTPPPITPDQIRPPPSSSETGSEQASSTGNGATVDMLETFMKDPEMQELLYQYLPENMRNKETFEWMLKDPTYRSQLEAMLKQQVLYFLGKWTALQWAMLMTMLLTDNLIFDSSRGIQDINFSSEKNSHLGIFWAFHWYCHTLLRAWMQDLSI